MRAPRRGGGRRSADAPAPALLRREKASEQSAPSPGTAEPAIRSRRSALGMSFRRDRAVSSCALWSERQSHLRAPGLADADPLDRDAGPHAASEGSSRCRRAASGGRRAASACGAEAQPPGASRPGRRIGLVAGAPGLHLTDPAARRAARAGIEHRGLHCWLLGVGLPGSRRQSDRVLHAQGRSRHHRRAQRLRGDRFAAPDASGITSRRALPHAAPSQSQRECRNQRLRSAPGGAGS